MHRTPFLSVQSPPTSSDLGKGNGNGHQEQSPRQALHFHSALHNGERFIRARDNYLFPVKALSKVFRGRFIDALKKMFAKGDLIFPGKIASLGTSKGFSDLVSQLWQKDWVVYAKAPFNGPEKVLDSLGCYTHRVAIANHRIAKVEDGSVTFRYRDRRDGDRCKQMTIGAGEFIRRFLLHVLPDSFMRIRHYGFLANRCKKQHLPRCRELLGFCLERLEPPSETVQEKVLRLTGVDMAACLCCKQGRMRRVTKLTIPSVPTPEACRMLPQVLDSS